MSNSAISLPPFNLMPSSWSDTDASFQRGCLISLRWEISTCTGHCCQNTGDILLQKEIPIAVNDTAETLAPRMAADGADLMVETIRGLQAGTIHPRPQDHAAATLAPILKKEDGRIDFHLTAREILNRLR